MILLRGREGVSAAGSGYSTRQQWWPSSTYHQVPWSQKLLCRNILKPIILFQGYVKKCKKSKMKKRSFGKIYGLLPSISELEWAYFTLYNISRGELTIDVRITLRLLSTSKTPPWECTFLVVFLHLFISEIQPFCLCPSTLAQFKGFMRRGDEL